LQRGKADAGRLVFANCLPEAGRLRRVLLRFSPFASARQPICSHGSRGATDVNPFPCQHFADLGAFPQETDLQIFFRFDQELNNLTGL
jgi:hypothetical protein